MSSQLEFYQGGIRRINPRQLELHEQRQRSEERATARTDLDRLLHRLAPIRSQPEVARILGVTRQNISNIERKALVKLLIGMRRACHQRELPLVLGSS